MSLCFFFIACLSVTTENQMKGKHTKVAKVGRVVVEYLCHDRSEDSKIIGDILWRPPLHYMLNWHVINSSCSPAQAFRYFRGLCEICVFRSSQKLAKSKCYKLRSIVWIFTASERLSWKLNLNLSLNLDVFYLGAYWHQWKKISLQITFLKSPTPTAFGELGHSTCWALVVRSGATRSHGYGRWTSRSSYWAIDRLTWWFDIHGSNESDVPRWNVYSSILRSEKQKMIVYYVFSFFWLYCFKFIVMFDQKKAKRFHDGERGISKGTLQYCGLASDVLPLLGC